MQKVPDLAVDEENTFAQTTSMGPEQKQPAFKGVGLRHQTPFIINNAHSPAASGSVLNRTTSNRNGSAMFSQQAWTEIARSLRLSGRELEIVRGMFDDQKEVVIANTLGVSVHTIHTHSERLRHKLAVVDRAQLLLRVVQEFLAMTASPENVLPPICANRAKGRCPLRL